MLDSDSLPLRNPEYLFRAPQYAAAGSLLFSDWWDIVEWVKPEAYTTFGFPFPGLQAATLAAESGQVLLNRRARPPWELGMHGGLRCACATLKYVSCLASLYSSLAALLGTALTSNEAGRCRDWRVMHVHACQPAPKLLHTRQQPSGRQQVQIGSSWKLSRLCRSEHADVLEWLWFLNAHPETVYKLMYGDKDTFRLAFHLAGKAAAYQQACPPHSKRPAPHACKLRPSYTCMYGETPRLTHQQWAAGRHPAQLLPGCVARGGGAPHCFHPERTRAAECLWRLEADAPCASCVHGQLSAPLCH